MEFVTHSREETEALGARLAEALAVWPGPWEWRSG